MSYSAPTWWLDFNYALNSNKSSLFLPLLAALSPRFIRHISVHQCISSLLCPAASRESYCPLVPAVISNTTELIVQPSTRQYPGTLPVARYQDLSWAAMHDNRFYWLEWCTLLAMTLAYRSLSNGCFSLSLSPVTRPLIQQSMLLILIAPLLLPRGEKRRNQGEPVSNHSSEVKTAITDLMDLWKSLNIRHTVLQWGI